jgi:tetratricopeptide (TPR) repeat protein
MVSRYQSEAAARIGKAFPSWDAIKSAASRSESTGLVTNPHADEFGYLDVSHFTALFNNEFDILVPVDGLPPEVVQELKRQMLGYLREIKTVRDPVSHPSDDDLDPFDTLRALDNAVRVLHLLDLSEMAQVLIEMRTEVAGRAATSSGGSSFSDGNGALPPRDAVVVDFVGRRTELGRLWEWIVDSQSRRWLLTGDGGKGKSAIAYQFASEIISQPELEFAAVHWLSAKRRRFSEGHVLEIATPDFWDLESAVNRLLIEFGWSEHITKTLDTKRLLLCQLVKEFPCFLVVDDIDSLDPDQEDAVEYLASELPAAGAKVLLTSRRSILGMGKSSSVIVGLLDDEAEEFIDSRLGLFGLDSSRISTKQRKRIIKTCEGSPLYMEDLLRLCSFLPISQALDSWVANTGENVRRYALQREMELMSREAREVLEACCIVDGPATALEVQRIVGKGEETVLEALDELRRHHLVPAPELIEDIPRFTINSNLRSLVLGSLLGTQRLLSLEAAVAAVTGGDLIGKSSRAIEDYRRQAEVLLRSNHFLKAEETLQRGLEVHPNNAQLYFGLGFVYDRWKPQRVADARSAWQRAYELGSRDRRLYLAWTKLEDQEHEWHKMLVAAEMGLERLANDDDPALLQQAGYAASRLAQGLRSSFNTTRASQEFERSDVYLSKAIKSGKRQGIAKHFIARSYRAWVVNAQLNDNGAELCRRLRQWIEWDPHDATAREEAERQGSRCPDVIELLDRHG